MTINWISQSIQFLQYTQYLRYTQYALDQSPGGLVTLTGNIHWGRENLEGDLEETIRNRFIQMSKYLKLFSHKSNISEYKQIEMRR